MNQDIGLKVTEEIVNLVKRETGDLPTIYDKHLQSGVTCYSCSKSTETGTRDYFFHVKGGKIIGKYTRDYASSGHQETPDQICPECKTNFTDMLFPFRHNRPNPGAREDSS